MSKQKQKGAYQKHFKSKNTKMCLSETFEIKYIKCAYQKHLKANIIRMCTLGTFGSKK